MSGAEIEGGKRADKICAPGVVFGGEERSERDRDEIGVAVIGLAIGEGELRALDERVHEVRAERVHRREIEVLEQRELLEEDRALAPGPAFEHRVAVIVERDRVFDARLPAGEVVGREEAAMALARGVEHFVEAEEPVDRLGDEAAVPGVAGGVDPGLARVALGFGADPGIGRGERGVGEQAAGRRHRAVRQVDRGARRPGALEERADALDRGRDARHEVDSVGGVADREGEHVGELPGAPIAEEEAPGVEGPGNDRRQEAGAGDEVEPEVGEMGEGCGRRGDALPADDVLGPGAGRMEDDRRVAAGAVEMGLRHLQREGGGGGGIEGIATALEHGHADPARDPVRAGDDAEGGGDLGAGREHRGSLEWLTTDATARSAGSKAAPLTRGLVRGRA